MWHFEIGQRLTFLQFINVRRDRFQMLDFEIVISYAIGKITTTNTRSVRQILG